MNRIARTQRPPETGQLVVASMVADKGEGAARALPWIAAEVASIASRPSATTIGLT
jgi:hypothetical protein